MADPASAAPAADHMPWRERARNDLEKTRDHLKRQIKKVRGEIERETTDPKSRHWYAPKNKGYYWALVGAYLLAQAVVGFDMANMTFGSTPFFVNLAGLAVNSTPFIVNLGVPVDLPLAVLLLQIVHFAASIRSVEVDKLAGLTFFGRPLYELHSGLYVIPRGLVRLVTASRNYRDKRFPGPADQIYRVSAEEQKKSPFGDAPPPGSGMVRPILVTTGEPKLTREEQKQQKGGVSNPLDRQLSVEIAYYARFRPNQEFGGIFRIARNLTSQSNDIDDRIEDLIQEQSERDIKSILTQLTPATIIENWSLINEVFVLKLRLGVLRLGIDIDNGSGLDDLNPSHSTNEAQAEVAREEFKKAATIRKAEAEREKRTLEGQGAANAELARLKAVAEGTNKIKDNLKVPGETVMAAEAARTLGDKTVVLGAEGVAQVTGLVDVLRKGFPSAPPTQPKP